MCETCSEKFEGNNREIHEKFMKENNCKTIHQEAHNSSKGSDFHNEITLFGNSKDAKSIDLLCEIDCFLRKNTRLKSFSDENYYKKLMLETKVQSKPFSSCLSLPAAIYCSKMMKRILVMAKDSYINNTMKCNCDICKKTKLVQMAERIEAHMKSSGSSQLSSCDVFNLIENGSFEKNMLSGLNHLFIFVKNNFRIRTTELIQGLNIFTRICYLHHNCRCFFTLFRNSLKTLIVSSILIAHKMNADATISNKYWAPSFGLTPKVLGDFEDTVLDLSDWNLLTSEIEYLSFELLLTEISKYYNNINIEESSDKGEEEEKEKSELFDEKMKDDFSVELTEKGRKELENEKMKDFVNFILSFYLCFSKSSSVSLDDSII